MTFPKYIDNETVEQRIESAHDNSTPILIKERDGNRYVLIQHARLTENGFIGEVPNQNPWGAGIEGDELLIAHERIRFDGGPYDPDEFSPIDIVQQCRRYVETLDRAETGLGGTAQTMRVAQIILHDFALDEVDAWIVLLEYNTRCRPCWSVKELRHLMAQAEDSPPTDRPRGRLRNKFAVEKFDIKD